MGFYGPGIGGIICCLPGIPVISAARFLHKILKPLLCLPCGNNPAPDRADSQKPDKVPPSPYFMISADGMQGMPMFLMS